MLVVGFDHEEVRPQDDMRLHPVSTTGAGEKVNRRKFLGFDRITRIPRCNHVAGLLVLGEWLATKSDTDGALRQVDQVIFRREEDGRGRKGNTIDKPIPL